MAKMGDGIASAPLGGKRGGAMGSGAVNVVFQAGAIVVNGGAGAIDDLRSQFADLMADTFQQAALAQGTG